MSKLFAGSVLASARGAGIAATAVNADDDEAMPPDRGLVIAKHSYHR